MNFLSRSKNGSSPQSEETPSDSSNEGYISTRLVTAEPRNMSPELLEIFSQNVLAKLLRVAEEALEDNVS
jgi:hypothetical protein